MNEMSELKPLPYQMTIEVIFRDVDAMGHVNNAVYFTYMETARTKFFSERLKINRLSELPVIVAETSCRYKSAAQFGENLLVGMGVSHIGNRSFDFNYQISGQDSRIVAMGQSIMVAYDYAQEKSVAIPPDLLIVLKEYKTSKIYL